MDSTATSPYLPALPVPHEREGVGLELQTVLAELVALSLGFVPDGQAQAVAAASQLARVPRGPIEDHVVVREITHRLADVWERVRSRLNRIGGADLASQDVLIEVVRELEKQQWMLRVQLAEGA